MVQKNDTLPLLIAFITCGTILGSVAWWFFVILTPHSGKINIPGEIATFGEVSQVQEGNFRYGGSTTFAPIRIVVDRQILSVFPKFQLIYVDPISGTPGSGKGIEMLIENQLTFSQSSRSVKNEEQTKAQAKGFALQEISVAIDGIAIAVNPNLSVSGLTITQLKAIYTGKITNWQQLGGPNLVIIPYSRNLKDGGTVEFFQDHVLSKESFGKNIQYVYSTTPGLKKVSENLGGIYYASAPEVVPQCGIKPLPLGKKEGEWITEKLQGYRLNEEGLYKSITDNCSEVLQLKLQAEDYLIGFYRLDNGEKLLTPEELYTAAQEANQKVEEARLMATQEKAKAEEAHLMATQEKAMADRLAEKLRQLGVDLE